METVLTNNLNFSDFENQMREYARQNNVPIITDTGLAFLEMIIGLKKPQKILEIGTAIGYSAIRMNKVCNSEIYTIERNAEMFNQAKENVKALNLENRIHLIFKDALEAFDYVKNNSFDLIFIDAAKAQYMKFFELYTPLLNDNGVVVCDNMFFHGLVGDKEHYNQQSRSVRGLIRKLSNFHDALITNNDFSTSIYSIGDGIAVSIKRS